MRENMLYTQLFINYLSSKDPRKIKFFDESGVKTPDVGTRLYGHAPGRYYRNGQPRCPPF